MGGDNPEAVVLRTAYLCTASDEVHPFGAFYQTYIQGAEKRMKNSETEPVRGYPKAYRVYAE